MQKRLEGKESSRYGETNSFSTPGDSRFVFGAFWAILFVFTFLVSGPWAGFHGVLLGCAGLLIALRPPTVALPRIWWLLGAIFMIAGATSFLPATWMTQPEWRKTFEEVGIVTGPRIVIQARQAAEAFALFLIMLFVGLWLAGHRPSSSQLRTWSLALTLGVAVYAIVARIVQQNSLPDGDALFGFFPNRNHSATYLAMGSICGLGCVLQALREKRFLVLTLAILATGVCLWAVAAWSMSRAGVALVAVGVIIWLSMLGKHYLGQNGLWAIGLTALAAVGLFLIADSGVKQRISKTAEKASSIISSEDMLSPAEGKPESESVRDLDFRIPTALDTLSLIRDFRWTGIGAGQFNSIFPQYRKLTAVANDSDSYHPESDWLWMASETGIPATLALAALVGIAFRKSLVSILQGRERALRSACLVAAMLVPIHGIFDVPGHRITLAWSAALLFALSLRSPADSGSEQTAPRAWPFRFAALGLLAACVFLIRAQWWGGPQPAFVAATVARADAQRLYDEDRALQQAAFANGQEYQPAPTEDLVEKALKLLKQAAAVAPLDRDLTRYQGFLGFCFDDKYELIDQSFAIDRTLDPTWVVGPLRQAEAWAPIDPHRTTALWTEALRRAGRLDQLRPDGRGIATEQAKQTIKRIAKGKPELEKFLLKIK